MLDQMAPRPAHLDKLAQASNALHSRLAAAETLLKGARPSFDSNPNPNPSLKPKPKPKPNPNSVV